MGARDIETRGRTPDAVVNPKNYKPFSRIPDRNAFESAWKSNPDWIFANMAHAAYFDKEYLERLFKQYEAKIKFYESKPDENRIIRGREAFLAVWNDKAILSFRGTEADDAIKIKISAKYISAAKKYLGIDIPAEIGTLFPADLFDDAAFDEHLYKGAKVHGGFFRATEELWPKEMELLQVEY